MKRKDLTPHEVRKWQRVMIAIQTVFCSSGLYLGINKLFEVYPMYPAEKYPLCLTVVFLTGCLASSWVCGYFIYEYRELKQEKNPTQNDLKSYYQIILTLGIFSIFCYMLWAVFYLIALF